METHEHQNIPEIKFNIDEFDLENYEFSPITEGLGFHSEKEKKTKINITKQKAKTSLGLSIERPKVKAGTILSKSFSDGSHTSGLEAFYQTRFPQAHEIKKEKKKKKIKEAGEVEQFGAFLIDMTILLSIYLFMVISFSVIAGLRFSGENLFLFFQNFVGYFALLFSLIFLFYFTLLDISGSIGKRIMGIKLISNRNDNDISIEQSFFRSLVTLTSIVLLGFPLLVDFQGKLSDTKVVK